MTLVGADHLDLFVADDLTGCQRARQRPFLREICLAAAARAAERRLERGFLNPRSGRSAGWCRTSSPPCDWRTANGRVSGSRMTTAVGICSSTPCTRSCALQHFHFAALARADVHERDDHAFDVVFRSAVGQRAAQVPRGRCGFRSSRSMGTRCCSTLRASDSSLSSVNFCARSVTGRPMSVSMSSSRSVTVGVKRRTRNLESRNTTAMSVLLSRLAMSLVVASSWRIFDCS